MSGRRSGRRCSEPRADRSDWFSLGGASERIFLPVIAETYRGILPSKFSPAPLGSGVLLFRERPVDSWGNVGVERVGARRPGASNYHAQ